MTATSQKNSDITASRGCTNAMGAKQRNYVIVIAYVNIGSDAMAQFYKGHGQGYASLQQQWS